MRARRALSALVLVLGLLATACSDPVTPGSTGSADCTSQIKADGTVYTSYGSTRRDATEHGVALEAVCEDVGADARGSVFTDESREVTTYRIAGYPPAQVLGVRYRQLPRLTVFVADSVDADEWDRIYRELRD